MVLFIFLIGYHSFPAVAQGKASELLSPAYFQTPPTEREMEYACSFFPELVYEIEPFRMYLRRTREREKAG